MATSSFTNRLARETSPYLRQHAHNPVDWYPWGDEALERARREDRPILLSIGYAACHWCHVMERESFEDEATARQMNEHFVCVKVDREERPDLDAIYMQATQMLTGAGGWPMTVFLTPEGVPFFAGTYFPPDNRRGMPSFRQVLTAMAEAWTKRRHDVLQSAGQIERALGQGEMLHKQGAVADRALLDTAVERMARRYDAAWGGFGDAPKFPQPMNLEFVLRQAHRKDSPRLLKMVTHTLERMSRGGIYDHLGGGFARYSVDETWLVPHFEKMLYDNAQLAALFVAAWQATGEPRFRRVATETIEYVLRDMTSPEGAFHATEDADSEGEEGRFYVWTPAQVRDVLGDDRYTAALLEYFDVTPGGNFEHGTSIVHTPHEIDVVAARHDLATADLQQRVEEARVRLFEARKRRVRPGRDDKVITCWNGLMLDALSRAGAALARPDWLEAARRNATFLLERLRVEEEGGRRLLRVHMEGQSRLNGYLEDYAALAGGLLSLYEATLETRWFVEARAIVDRMLALFWDEEAGAFFFTSVDHEKLIMRPQDPFDNATPSGNSLAVEVLLRLHALTADERYRAPATRVLQAFATMMAEAPLGFGRLLCALDFEMEGPVEVALVEGPATPLEPLAAVVFGAFIPRRVVAGARQGDLEAAAAAIPLLEGRAPVMGSSAAYVCRGFTCRAPIVDPEVLAKELGVARPAAATPPGWPALPTPP